MTETTADSASGAAHDTGDAGESGALVSRLHLIEDQPLASRADALAQVHDELKAALEAGDARSHG